jgi:hypothetical protein
LETTKLLWVDPEIYTLKELLDVYPGAKIFDTTSNRIIELAEIEAMTNRENGSNPLVDDIRWDRIYLLDLDNQIIPLSAAELKLSNSVAEIQYQVESLKSEIEIANQIKSDTAITQITTGILIGSSATILLQKLWYYFFRA